MGNKSIKKQFINYLVKDDLDNVKNMLENSKYSNIFIPDEYINNDGTFTALNICSTCGSIKCAEYLIEKKWTIMFQEKEEKNTSLMLACKFGFLNLVTLYIDKYNTPLNYTNIKGMNILDISIIYGQYDIAYYLHKDLGLELRPVASDYSDIMKKNQINKFDIQKFYHSLVNNIPPDKAKTFFLKRKTKEEREKEIINNLGRVKINNNNKNNNNNEKNNNEYINNGNQINNNEYKNNGNHINNNESINEDKNKDKSSEYKENNIRNESNLYDEYDDDEEEFGTNKVSQKKTYDYIGAIISEEGFVEHDDAFYRPNVNLKIKGQKNGFNVTTGYRLINDK